MNVFRNYVLFCFSMISPDQFSSIRQSFIRYFSDTVSSAEKWPKIISFCKIQIPIKLVYILLFISVGPKFHLLSSFCLRFLVFCCLLLPTIQSSISILFRCVIFRLIFFFSIFIPLFVVIKVSYKSGACFLSILRHAFFFVSPCLISCHVLTTALSSALF